MFSATICSASSRSNLLEFVLEWIYEVLRFDGRSYTYFILSRLLVSNKIFMGQFVKLFPRIQSENSTFVNVVI